MKWEPITIAQLDQAPNGAVIRIGKKRFIKIIRI